jgi:hypothetical protein
MVRSRFFRGFVISTLLIATVCRAQTFNGYTFTFNGTKAYLYGMDKTVIHTWTLPKSAVGCADLLRDSSVLYPSSDKGAWTNNGALQGGRLQIVKWDGTVTWDYLYRSADYMPHHDIEPVYYTNDPKEKPNVLVICYTATWGDKITELKPTGLNTADVVWEWVASNHTCESGGTDKPQLLDKSKAGTGMGGAGNFDKMHTNYVSYHRALNQLVINAKNYNEFMVIDHSTTTAEAKGSTGGRYGKGGDILYRWGCPANYGATGTKYMNGQHNGSWILDTFPGTNLPLPGARNMMCVDNGGKKIVEIVTAGNKDGVYPRTAGAAFAPASPLWSFPVSDVNFVEGSAQRLPNGNTLICTGGAGAMGGGGGAMAEGTEAGMGGGNSRVFEVTSAGTNIWEISVPQSCEAMRYAFGYLDGKTGVGTGNPVVSAKQQVKIALDAVSGRVRVLYTGNSSDAQLSLFSLGGKELFRTAAKANAYGWDLGNRPNGQYLAKITTGNGVMWERVVIQR